MKTKSLITLVATGLSAAAVATTPAEPAGPASAAKTEVLVKSENAWNGKPYERYAAGTPQLTVLRIEIPAHTALPWHTHLIPNAAYIVSGHLTVEDRATGKKRTVHAGEAFNEQVGAEHRGYTDEEPCTVVVTYAGTAATPTSIPAAGEKPVY
jgi:quercetin dioxygenase-like cupin family protein